MYIFCYVFLTFFIFSVIGWISECIFCSIKEKRLIMNRGFLIGPYCPIYGFGALFLYLTTYIEYDIVLYTIIMVLGISILEYFTSYIMEKAFKARWWDYSDEFLNINGRICLKNTVLFIIGGLIFAYIVKPIYVDLISSIPENIFIIITTSIMIVYSIDCIISFTIMNRIKKSFTNMQKDSTEEIEKEVNKVLSKHRFYAKKLFNSFPNLSLKIPSGKDIRNTIQEILRKERGKISKKGR